MPEQSNPECACALGPWEACPCCGNSVSRYKGNIVSPLEWRAALGDPDAREILGMEPWAFLDA